MALAFEQYGDGRHASGVTAFALEPDAIHVQFHDRRVYVYDSVRPGIDAVRQMQRLAVEGRGLSTFISQRVQHRYSRWYAR